MRYIGIFEIDTTTSQGMLLITTQIFDVVENDPMDQAKQVGKNLSTQYLDRYEPNQILIEFNIMELDTFLQFQSLTLINDGKSYWYGSLDEI
jgi:hypothetical protein